MKRSGSGTKVLRFAVTGALLGGGTAAGCDGDTKEPEPDRTINMVREPEPEPDVNVNVAKEEEPVPEPVPEPAPKPDISVNPGPEPALEPAPEAELDRAKEPKRVNVAREVDPGSAKTPAPPVDAAKK